MKIANAKDGYGLCVCAKDGCDLKGEQKGGCGDKVIDDGWDLKMTNA